MSTVEGVEGAEGEVGEAGKVEVDPGERRLPSALVGQPHPFELHPARAGRQRWGVGRARDPQRERVAGVPSSSRIVVEEAALCASKFSSVDVDSDFLVDELSAW